MLRELSENYQQATRRIHEEGARLSHQSSSNLLGEAEAKRQHKEKLLMMHTEGLQAFEEAFRSTVTFSQALLAKGSPSDIVSKEKQLLSRFGTLRSVSIILEPPCDSVLEVVEINGTDGFSSGLLVVTGNLLDSKKSLLQKTSPAEEEVTGRFSFTISPRTETGKPFPRGCEGIEISVIGPTDVQVLIPFLCLITLTNAPFSKHIKIINI